MPEALTTKPGPYKHEWRPGFAYNKVYTGWTAPPKDYGKWAELVYQWVKRCVERYGRAEVETWYWQVWNEPNIGYWSGTPQEFHKLHDYAIDAVRRALPTARVGGPDVAAFAGRDGNRLCVMVWHYHDDDVPGADAAVELAVAGLAPETEIAKLTHYRIDEHHGNAYAAWQRMGSPVAPNERLYAQLQEASQLTPLTGAPASVTVSEGAATLGFNLPRQGVSLVVLEW